jgi:Stage III sporulation protein AB (spore_III_AB).
MVKIIGAIIIISISTLTGFFFSQKFSERCRLLKLWLQILEIFQTEICFEAQRLPEVFRRTAALLDDRNFSHAFIRLASSLEFGSDEDFEAAWQYFLTQTGMGILHNNDYLALNELGNYLGSTDRSDQMTKLNTCRATLALNVQKAESEQNKRARIYRYLGFAAGVIIVLWLI